MLYHTPMMKNLGTSFLFSTVLLTDFTMKLLRQALQKTKSFSIACSTLVKSIYINFALNYLIYLGILQNKRKIKDEGKAIVQNLVQMSQSKNTVGSLQLIFRLLSGYF